MSMYSDQAGVVRSKVLDSEPNVRPSLIVAFSQKYLSPNAFTNVAVQVCRQ